MVSGGGMGKWRLRGRGKGKVILSSVSFILAISYQTHTKLYFFMSKYRSFRPRGQQNKEKKRCQVSFDPPPPPAFAPCTSFSRGVWTPAVRMREQGANGGFLRICFNMDYFRSVNINNMADSMKKFGAQTATFFSRAKQVRFLIPWRFLLLCHFCKWIFISLVHRGATRHLREDYFWREIRVACGKGRSHEILDRKIATTNRSIATA